MTDLSQTIIPKSDQLNADDLLTGPRTIRVTKVSGASGDQPISIHFEGDDGKPWKPCKSMRRVLVACWGADGGKYAGRSIALYADPKVKFGGIEVGGIRVSALSHIDSDITLPLTTKRGAREPYRVKRLDVKEAPKQAADAPTKDAGNITQALRQIETWTGDLAPLKNKLNTLAWTKDERSQIGAAIKAKEQAMAEARTVTVGEDVPE